LLELELTDKNEEIARLSQELANQVIAMQREKLAVREMHTLVVRLQDKAAQN